MITPAPVDPAALLALQIASLQAERSALVSAIATGVTSCSYEGKNVSYDSLNGMKMRLSFIDGQIAQLAGTSAQTRKPQAGFANFSRGYSTRTFGAGGFFGYRG